MQIRPNLSGFVVLLLVGCGKTEEGNDKGFMPLESGFGYVTHVKGYTDRKLSVGLWYQDSSGKRTKVWPYLQMVWGDNIQITNNVAVMVGGVASIYEDGRERLSDRLIAFRGSSGPPLDITDQVLLKYCAESGVPFSDIVKDSFHSITKTNDALEIIFVVLKRGLRGTGTIDADGGTEIISWHDIETIIQDVEKNGKLKKEKWSGMDYLQKN